MTDIDAYLSDAYDRAMSAASGQEKVQLHIDTAAQADLDMILSKAENSKGVLAVAMTSLVYKHFHPEQDIRKHQQSIENGYSGRTFDTKHITPFLKSKRFPSMAESGWLTRSLEQKVPYDKNYPGAINPPALKEAFLGLLDKIESGLNPEPLTDYLLQGLIIQRDKQQIQLARPQNLSIEAIMKLLKAHFSARYASEGASRLPVLSIYAVYACLMPELQRFRGKTLLPLENHTSADARSGRLGDIDIVDEDNKHFEAIEVKFDIPIDHNIVEIAKEKIHPAPVKRYYILSTAEPKKEDMSRIENDIRQIKNTHGCQLIINGIYPTLKYYLRLLDNPSDFIQKYAELLESDKTIKFEHKERWNALISNL